MRKWYVPLTVAGIGGLGAFLLTESGREFLGLLPPPGVPNPSEWGDESVVQQRFGSRAKVTATRKPIRIDLPFGPQDAQEYFRQHIGPAQVAFSRLDPAGQEQLAAALQEHWTRENRGDENRTIVETEYLEVHARPN